MISKPTKHFGPQQVTLILLVIALVMLGTLIAFAPLPAIDYWGIDIYTFRAGAKAMALDENPYDELNILRFADGVEVGNIHNFAYAPFFGFVLRPLAWLHPVAASRVWFLFNLIFYFSSLMLLIKAINWRPARTQFWLVMLGLLLYPPLRTTLIIGQNTLFLLFWFSLSYYWLKRGRPILGGFSLSLTLFKPHLAPLLLFYALKRQGSLLIGFGLGSLVLTLPFWGYLFNWIGSATTAYTLNITAGGCLRMVSLTATLQCFGPSGWFQPAAIGLLIGGIAWGLLPRFWSQTSLTKAVFDRHTAWMLAVILLMIDNVRIADQMLLIFPLLVVWRDWRLLDQGRLWLRRLAIALLATVYVTPYVVDFLRPYNIAFILPLWYLSLTLAVIGMLLLEEISLTWRRER